MDVQTSKTKRTFAEIQEEVLRDATAGSMANPLRISGASLAALQQVLAEKLGERDTRRFSDVHLQNLLDKGYSDEGALQDATCEGLQTPPALPPALIDKVLKAFGQPGEKYVYVDVCIHMCTLLHMFVFEEHVIADLMSMWASCY